MNLPRILTSSKFQAALAATVFTGIPLLFTLTNKSIDRQTKQDATTAAVHVIGAAWVAAIAATGIEDAADKHKPGPTSPLQVNANTSDSTQANATPPPDASPPSATGVIISPKPPTPAPWTMGTLQTGTTSTGTTSATPVAKYHKTPLP